jgi:hypothetical protein
MRQGFILTSALVQRVKLYNLQYSDLKLPDPGSLTFKIHSGLLLCKRKPWKRGKNTHYDIIFCSQKLVSNYDIVPYGKASRPKKPYFGLFPRTVTF